MLSVDLSAYQTASTFLGRLVAQTRGISAKEGRVSSNGILYGDLQVGDYFWDMETDRLGRVVAISQHYTDVRGILELQKFRTLIPTTTLDVAAGQTGSGKVDVNMHAVMAGTLILNTTSGNLMTVTDDVRKPYSGSDATVSVLGLGCVFGGGASYTASYPLSIDANNDISVDLTGYAALSGAAFTGAVSGVAPTESAHFATKKYVDDAISALADLSEESF
jgi:hypothetical protein